MAAYTYLIALALISVFVAVLEWLFPLRPQRRLRRALVSDFVHLAFNGHLLGIVLYGIATNRVLPVVDDWVGGQGFSGLVGRHLAADWSLWIQIPVALVVIDFLQWGVHNLLHRVPFLWPLHQTHHSVKDGEMDWIVSFRFQWSEVVVYKSILYVPLAFFGFSSEAMLFHAIFGTLIGHLNHANLDLGHGWWRYILNSPRMHLWHHDRSGDAKTTVNFGIIFSMWDWLFGTAKMPDEPPAHIGFMGDQQFPNDFFGQAAWPLPALFGARLYTLPARIVSSTVGIAVVVGLYLLSLPPAPKTPLLGERAAASQPMRSGSGFDYPRSPDEAGAAMARFGEEARVFGYAHPEHMVSVDEVARALTSPALALIDVRPRARFVTGHVPGARHAWRSDYATGHDDAVPGLSVDARTLAEMLAARGVTPAHTIVLMGDGGPEPYRLWWTLSVVLGVHARMLEGGLGAWKNAGHGVVEGEGIVIAPVDATLWARGDALFPTTVTWSTVAHARAREGSVLIDTRSLAEFTGTEQHDESVRVGRVPGAQHLEWTSVLVDESAPRLKRPDDLRALFDEVGLHALLDAESDSPIVLMCQSGTRSATVLFALHQLGVSSARLMNYDGSFAEYSRQPLPVETGSGGT